MWRNVATSNSMNIPPALLDRMEVIRLSGYTEDEKTSIAMKYLLPKQLKNNGVKDEELLITEPAVRDMVRYYTREAGVLLERELSKICRKVVKGLQLKKLEPQVVVTADNLPDFGRAQADLRPCRTAKPGSRWWAWPPLWGRSANYEWPSCLAREDHAHGPAGDA